MPRQASHERIQVVRFQALMEPTGQRAYRPRKDEATDSPAQRQVQVGAPKSNFLLYQFAKPILPMELAAKAVMHLLKRQLPA